MHCLLSVFAKRREDLGGVVFDIDLIEDMDDLTVFVDQKGLARNTHIGLAHKLLLAVNSVEFADLMFGIGDQS